MRPKILYIGDKTSKMPTSGLFVDELKKLGDLTLIRVDAARDIREIESAVEVTRP